MTKQSSDCCTGFVSSTCFLRSSWNWVVTLQYEHHLLLQRLQRAEQCRLHVTAVMLMVHLSCSHREDVLIMELVEFHHGLDVTLFVLVSVLIWTQTNRFKRKKKKKTPQGLSLKVIQEVNIVWKAHLYLYPGTFSLPELHLYVPACSCSSASPAPNKSPSKYSMIKSKLYQRNTCILIGWSKEDCSSLTINCFDDSCTLV